jgi:hypothetical protein
MFDMLQKFVPWAGSLPFVPKALLSLTLALLTGFLLVILWLPSGDKPVVQARNLWPEEKTFPALRRRIDRLSKVNRQILGFILDSGRDGLYPDQLTRLSSLSRNDVASRANELKAYDLVEVLELTDDNYRISESLRELFGPDDLEPLKRMLNGREASPVTPPAPTGQGGGLNLDNYCRASYGSQSVAAFLNQGGTHSWYCLVGTKRVVLSMDNACRAQYGAGKYAYSGDITDQYSWSCR